ncbi:putative 11-oxo-beta-amyrin 30-oxidase-like [Sesbania bispinosa]|nr:putative 11-oxo-beta-amyrin 30-oxidase-like [Sesbania bispinosa]
MEALSTASIWVLTVLLAVIPIWGRQMLNSLWLRPKRLEKLLRAQGLQGEPYKLSSVDDTKQKHILKMQQEAKSKPITLSNDVAPQVFSQLHQTVNQYGTHVVN